MIGTQAFGLQLPIIRYGDDLVEIIYNQIYKAYLENYYTPQERDIIGITESIVARAQGNYCSIEDICNDLEDKGFEKDHCYIFNPIFSRNRFSIILKAFAKYFDSITIVAKDVDEVGNFVNHPITKVNYKDFYKEIVNQENCEFEWVDHVIMNGLKCQVIDCSLHDLHETNVLRDLLGWNNIITSKHTSLREIMSNICEFGLLGSNKATEVTLKLFPSATYSKHVVTELQNRIKEKLGVTVSVMVYGDGCYKDPAGIWEFADPVVSPAFTDELIGSPNELKLKYLADEKFKNLNGEELEKRVREEINNKKVTQGEMQTQGTTPRQYVNLLGSLMDLVSGSGDKGTPVVIVKDYFKNYAC